MLVFVIIVFFLATVIGIICYNFSLKGVTHYMGHRKARFESVVFLLSSLALLVMAYPSFKLLYDFSTATSVNLMVKVVGGQWYWTFEIADLIRDSIPIYIVAADDLEVGELRLLEVDNRLVLPTGVLVQFNVTSSDVIHSFALPTLGIKVDATAGLLTIVPLWTSKIGVHYGQCSEICGINHAFIPFVCEITRFEAFRNWVEVADL